MPERQRCNDAIPEILCPRCFCRRCRAFSSRSWRRRGRRRSCGKQRNRRGSDWLGKSRVTRERGLTRTCRCRSARRREDLNQPLSRFDKLVLFTGKPTDICRLRECRLLMGQRCILRLHRCELLTCCVEGLPLSEDRRCGEPRHHHQRRDDDGPTNQNETPPPVGRRSLRRSSRRTLLNSRHERPLEPVLASRRSVLRHLTPLRYGGVGCTLLPDQNDKALPS